jgi:hypothetical protein
LSQVFFLPWYFCSWASGEPHHSGLKSQLVALSLWCVMFLVCWCLVQNIVVVLVCFQIFKLLLTISASPVMYYYFLFMVNVYNFGSIITRVCISVLTVGVSAWSLYCALLCVSVSSLTKAVWLFLRIPHIIGICFILVISLIICFCKLFYLKYTLWIILMIFPYSINW